MTPEPSSSQKNMRLSARVAVPHPPPLLFEVDPPPKRPHDPLHMRRVVECSASITKPSSVAGVATRVIARTFE